MFHSGRRGCSSSSAWTRGTGCLSICLVIRFPGCSLSFGNWLFGMTEFEGSAEVQAELEGKELWSWRSFHCNFGRKKELQNDNFQNLLASFGLHSFACLGGQPLLHGNVWPPWIKEQLPCNRNILNPFVRNSLFNHSDCFFRNLLHYIVFNILNRIVIVLCHHPRH